MGTSWYMWLEHNMPQRKKSKDPSGKCHHPPSVSPTLSPHLHLSSLPIVGKQPLSAPATQSIIRPLILVPKFMPSS